MHVVTGQGQGRDGQSLGDGKMSARAHVPRPRTSPKRQAGLMLEHNQKSCLRVLYLLHSHTQGTFHPILQIIQDETFFFARLS